LVLEESYRLPRHRLRRLSVISLTLSLSFLPFTAQLPPFRANWLPLNVRSLWHRPIPLRLGGNLCYRFDEE
jgi:hypothetical protein